MGKNRRMRKLFFEAVGIDSAIVILRENIICQWCQLNGFCPARVALSEQTCEDVMRMYIEYGEKKVRQTWENLKD